MRQQTLKIFSFIVTTFVVTMLFSCENNLSNVSKISHKEYAPVNEAININLKHTDSGLIVANLISPKMLNYSNVTFPHTEFPNGIHLIIYDENGKKTNIHASYGISYSETKLIELRDQVKIITSDNKLLETDKLFYNQKEEWFFTDQKCKYSNPNGDYSYFKGFDCSKDFTVINAQSLSGATNIEEDQ